MYFRTMRIGLFVLLLFISAVGYSQSLVCKEGDRELFDSKKELLDQTSHLAFNERIVALGKSFIGTPYVGKTLEGQENETLVINLQELDCTTFVETVLALSRLPEQELGNFQAFGDTLQEIRYRGGNLDGYASRLHYFTEWIRDKEAMGMVLDLSRELGGIPLEKEINFMSSNRHLYPGLQEDEAFGEIKSIERQFKNHTVYFLPTQKVKEIESSLKSGDLVAMVTSIQGLDVSHTGILSREANGRIHLLHASTGAMEVVVSPRPFTAYLENGKHTLGILVARPVAPDGL